MSAVPGSEQPMIKGTIVGPSLEWISRTYGKTFFEAVCAKSPPASQELATKAIVSSSWYSLTAFDDLVQIAAVDAQKVTREPTNMFFQRMVMESGSQALVKVYKFVLRMFEPQTVIAKVLPLMKRTYNFGEIKVIENEPTRCVLVFVGVPPSAAESIRQGFPNAIRLVLDGCGCTAESQLVVPERSPEGDGFRVTTHYKKG